jgi:hypothetical protein
MYLCASKPPSIKYLLTPWIKAAIIYNDFFKVNIYQPHNAIQNPSSFDHLRKLFTFFLKLYPQKSKIDTHDSFCELQTRGNCHMMEQLYSQFKILYLGLENVTCRQTVSSKWPPGSAVAFEGVHTDIFWKKKKKRSHDVGIDTKISPGLNRHFF